MQITMKHSLTKHQTHWLIFFIGLVVFLFNLSPEFIAFQTRFALFAQEMLHHGIKLFPYTYQGPYPDYPALPTVLIYLFSLPFGNVTPFTATLPTAIAASLILVFIYLLGEMQSHRWGIYAVLLALLTQNFIDASRSISLDQYTSLMTIISFYTVYSADFYQKFQRIKLLPLFLTLGFLFRGPIGLIIPAAVVGGYYFCRHEFKRLIQFAFIAIMLLLILMAALLFAAYFEYGKPFAYQVLFMEATGRIRESGQNQPWWFYWIHSFANYAIAFPLAIIVILSQFKRLFRAFKSKQASSTYQFLLYLTCWLLIILIGMSIPDAKKIRYILPIVPACALLAAYLFVPEEANILFKWCRRFVLALCYLLPFIALIASVIAMIANKHYQLGLSFYHTFILSILLATATVWFSFAFKTSASKKYSIITIAAATLIIINFGILEPINYALERTKPFTTQLLQIEQQEKLPIAFYMIGPDEEDVKIMINWPAPFEPTFIQSQQELLSYPNEAYFIALKNDFDQLPKSKQIQPLFTGKIGHREAVVFRLNKRVDQ